MTPPCMLCQEPSVVELTRTEFAALNGGGYIQDALPERDAAFRELVKTGTHPNCWETLTHPEGVGWTDE